LEQPDLSPEALERLDGAVEVLGLQGGGDPDAEVRRSLGHDREAEAGD
jgi:hypothetical protein